MENRISPSACRPKLNLALERQAYLQFLGDFHRFPSSLGPVVTALGLRLKDRDARRCGGADERSVEAGKRQSFTDGQV